MGSLFSQPQIASIPGLTAALAGKLAAASNLSDLENFVTAKTNLQLQNVDNTRDTNKPISTATANALDAKAPLANPNFTGAVAVASGTLVASAPAINASQTWDNAAVTFIGLQFNATDTASASGSKLLDLKVGGVSRLVVEKSGLLKFEGANGCVCFSYSGATRQLWGYSDGLVNLMASNVRLAWESGATVADNRDAGIARNAAGVVEFNNGTAGTLRDWKARNGLLKEYFEIDDLTYTPAAGTGCGA